MKCHYCGKNIRFDERIFYVEAEPHHRACVPKALALQRRNALRRKVEREQQELIRWNF